MSKGKDKTAKRNQKNLGMSECNCEECVNDAINMVKKNIINKLNLLMPYASEDIVEEMLLSLKKGDGDTINAYANLFKILISS